MERTPRHPFRCVGPVRSGNGCVTVAGQPSAAARAAGLGSTALLMISRGRGSERRIVGARRSVCLDADTPTGSPSAGAAASGPAPFCCSLPSAATAGAGRPPSNSTWRALNVTASRFLSSESARGRRRRPPC